MYLLVGLGNPGLEYEGTRHNIGFDVVSAIAEQAGSNFRRGLGDFQVAKIRSVAGDIVLIKPITYMNRSGGPVKVALRQYEIDLSNMTVILDDFHIPLGSLRLREKGSAGGHNGLSSIIGSLGTNEFNRIRCGIASSFMPQDKERIPDFVLGKFRKSEQSEVQSMIDRAKDAALCAANDGFHKAMNIFNTKE